MGQYSLSREQAADIIKKGCFLSSSCFSGKKMNIENVSKTSIVAPKKIFKLAVNRNKAKRRFREAVRGIIPNASGDSFVFFLKKNILELSIEEIRKEIIKTIKK